MHLIQYAALSLLFSVSLLWQANAWSAHTETKRHLTAGVELFRWQEFDANQRRLLSEQGGRLSLQVDWDDVLPARRFGQINIQTRLYWGNINYDGQAQPSGTFVASTSRYKKGLDAAIESLHLLSHHNNTALLLGIGIDLWRRDIQDSTDALGSPVSGIKEDYRVVYSRLGLQQQDHGAYGHSQARIGIKYPLWVDEQVIGPMLRLTLRPDPAPSLFAAYRLHLADRRHTLIEIHYDSLRLDPSPIVTDQNGNSWLQPQSRYDSVGIRVGIPF